MRRFAELAEGTITGRPLVVCNSRIDAGRANHRSRGQGVLTTHIGNIRRKHNAEIGFEGRSGGADLAVAGH